MDDQHIKIWLTKPILARYILVNCLHPARIWTPNIDLGSWTPYPTAKPCPRSLTVTHGQHFRQHSGIGVKLDPAPLLSAGGHTKTQRKK